ncbi:MAG: response regulator transcription factor [Chloroflexi bacterium]|nr:response regulator transcription factor [Chloroflexota bacterium]
MRERLPRVVIVASAPLIREGLRTLLAREGIVTVADASSIDDLRDPFDGSAEALLVDPPLDAADELAAGLAAIRIAPVLLGPTPWADRLAVALRNRVWGYVSRRADGPTLAAALRAVSAGLVVIERTIASGETLSRGLRMGNGSPNDLTAREREVLQLVAEGLANKMIAARLAISEHTVKFHVAAILTKLGAASRTEATHTAARRGLIAL